MSGRVVTWVLDHSEAELAQRLVLVVLADHAKEDGTSAWPGVRTIARRARLDRRTVQRHLRDLEASGAITRAGVKSSGAVSWTVNMGGGTAPPPDEGAKLHSGGRHSAAGGAASDPKGGGAPPPEPSLEQPSRTVHTLRRTASPDVAEGGDYDHDQELEPHARVHDTASRAAGNGRDPAFEAVVEVTNATLSIEHGATRKALAAMDDEYAHELGRKPTREELAAEIHARGAAYRSTFRGRVCTPSALAKHWNRVEAAGDSGIAELVARVRDRAALGKGADD